MTVLDYEFDLADGVYDGDVEWEGMIRNPLGAVTASAIPVKPPAAWFQNPGFGQLEPLTVTADGRIAGHIASWREDHIGMNGRVRAPKSRTGYAFFATGCVETAEGTLVNCGQITLTGGHAPLEASVAEAVAHYDNTDSAFCDVAVGEDRHGIWVAGALRPTVDDSQLRAIRASSVSGDWRPINGSLEMVAVCAVNVPGFPIPRARVASGQPIALVAAGTGELVDLALHQDTAAADTVAEAFDDRLRFVEDVVLGRIGDRREVLAAAIDSARGDLPEDDGALLAAIDSAVDTVEARKEALRASVHALDVGPTDFTHTVDLDKNDRVAALRASVHGPSPDDRLDVLRASVHGPQLWDDDMPIELDLDECRQTSLRASVHGPIVGRATKAWTAEEREKAAKKGAAMPGGRYPIKDKADLRKAIHAVGRGKGDHAKIRAHIKKRAKALGAMDMIPDSWK